VLGAAVAAECDLIVTHDRGGFPPNKVLSRWDLAVMSPDDALTLLLGDLGVDVLADAFKSMTESLSRPPLDLADQLDRLADRQRGRCPFTATLLRAAYGDKKSLWALSDHRDALAENSPVSTVRALVRCVRDEDSVGSDRLLHSAARSRYGDTPQDRLDRVRRLLDGADRWGVVAKSVPLAVDRVEVLLVRRPATALASTHETTPGAALEPLSICVALVGDAWRIEDIGGA
jgi:hypothetical protein